MHGCTRALLLLSEHARCMRNMPPRCRLAYSMQLALAARTALVTLSHHARSLIPEAMCHEQLHCMRAPCTARPLSVSAWRRAACEPEQAAIQSCRVLAECQFATGARRGWRVARVCGDRSRTFAVCALRLSRVVLSEDSTRSCILKPHVAAASAVVPESAMRKPLAPAAHAARRGCGLGRGRFGRSDTRTVPPASRVPARSPARAILRHALTSPPSQRVTCRRVEKCHRGVECWQSASLRQARVGAGGSPACVVTDPARSRFAPCASSEWFSPKIVHDLVY